MHEKTIFFYEKALPGLSALCGTEPAHLHDPTLKMQEFENRKIYKVFRLN